MAAEPSSPIRAFMALDLDAASLRRMVRIADVLRMANGAPSASWVPPTGMHLTLKFMAELPVERVGPLGESLRPLADGQCAPAPCPLRLGAFPTTQRARVIVVELDDARGDLARLAESVDELAHRQGVARESRAFRPHVTLARIKRPYDASRWLRAGQAVAAGECRVASLTLFRSELGRDGARHTPLASFAFVPPGTG